MKKKDAIEEFLALSNAQKEAEYAKLDREDIGRTRPLNAAERKQWARIKGKMRRRGRPVLGKGATTVPLSIERDLLKQTDTFAKAKGLKRSQLIAMALRSILGKSKAG
jgi:hypothetical protein